VKRFTFDLEKVLELRAHREREAELALGKAVGALSRIERQIQTIAEQRVSAAAERFAPGNTTALIKQYDCYMLRLDTAKNALLEDAAKAALQVEEARKVYTGASRERKVIEKVKENREREYRKQFLAEEGKALDDLAGGAGVRRSIG
jgi:flagellar FliJ protein